MDGIKIEVTGNIAKVTGKPKRIIAGTIGLPIEFSFDESWDDIVKTAVFVAGENVSRLDEVENKTTVPWEVLQKPGPWLSIGIYGESIDGDKTIPTTWANVSPILFGTSLSGDPTDPSASPIWQKLKNEMEAVQKELEAEIKQRVKTVNGVAPDENGNVDVEVGSGGITGEADPTVPEWAKQPQKPSYTAQEVGALPADTVIPAPVTDEHINALIDAKLAELPAVPTYNGEVEVE